MKSMVKVKLRIRVKVKVTARIRQLLRKKKGLKAWIRIRVLTEIKDFVKYKG